MKRDDHEDGELRRLIALAFEGGGDGTGPPGDRLAKHLYPRVHAAVGLSLLRLRGVFYYRGGTPPVEDGISRVLMALWHNRGRALLAWEPDSPFGPYLRMIARNAALDVVRELNRSMPVVDEVGHGDDVRDPVDIERQTATKQELRRLLRALESEASPREMGIFQLCYVRGEAVQDAAKLLDISSNAASAALLRLRKRLAGIVARLFAEPPATPPPDDDPAAGSGSNDHGESANGSKGRGATGNGSKGNGSKGNNGHGLKVEGLKINGLHGDRAKHGSSAKGSMNGASKLGDPDAARVIDAPLHPDDAPPATSREGSGGHDAN